MRWVAPSPSGVTGLAEGASARVHGDTSQGYIPYLSPNYWNFQTFMFQYTTAIAAGQGIPGGSVTVSASFSMCPTGPCPR
jgi:hypothetical protein